MEGHTDMQNWRVIARTNLVKNENTDLAENYIMYKILIHLLNVNFQ